MFKKKPLKREKGFSLVESLILILVLSLTIGGLLQTSAYTIRMQMTGRRYVDTQVVAVSWFAALDQIPRTTLKNSHDVAFAAADTIIGAKSKAYIKEEKNFSLNGDGTMTVEITLTGENGVNSKARRIYNTYGNDTVPDKR